MNHKQFLAIRGPRQTALVNVGGCAHPLRQQIVVRGPVNDLSLSNTRRVNCSDLKRLVAEVCDGAQSDREKTTRLWQFVWDTMSPDWYPSERGDERAVHTHRNVIKNLNVYGTGDCGYHAYVLHLLLCAAGVKAQMGGGGGHSVVNVRFDGAWHMFDPVHHLFYRRSDGSIRSAEELVNEGRQYVRRYCDENGMTVRNHYYATFEADACWRNRNWRQAFSKYLPPQMPMGLTLKNDETLTIEFEGQGHYVKPFSEPLNYANGRLIYEPALGAKTFADDAINLFNFKSDGKRGLVTGDSDVSGEMVIGTSLPYVLTDGRLAIVSDGAIRIQLSVDEGRLWHDLPSGTKGASSFDITEHVRERYSFWIKLWRQADDPPVSLRKLRFEAWAQMNRNALPVLLKGMNRITAHSAAGGRGSGVLYSWRENPQQPDPARSIVKYLPRAHLEGFGRIEVVLKDKRGRPAPQTEVSVSSSRGKSDDLQRYYDYGARHGAKEKIYPFRPGHSTTDLEGRAAFIVHGGKAGKACFAVRAGKITLKTAPEIMFYPLAVTSLTAVSQAAGILLEWDHDSRIAGYEVHCSPRAGFAPSAGTRLLETNANRCLLKIGKKGIRPGDNYFFRVQAFDRRGKIAGWSRETSAAAGNLAFGKSVCVWGQARQANAALPSAAQIVNGKRAECDQAWTWSGFAGGERGITVDIGRRRINRIIYDNRKPGYDLRHCYQSSFAFFSSSTGAGGSFEPLIVKNRLKTAGLWIFDFQPRIARFVKLQDVVTVEHRTNGIRSPFNLTVSAIEVYNRE